MLIEKMGILDRVDRALQKLEESKHPNWDRGKGVACDVQTQILDLGGISELGGGSEATSAQKSSLGNLSPGTHLGEESPNGIATEVAPR